MKRIVAFLLSLALLLSGCASQVSTNTSEPDVNTEDFFADIDVDLTDFANLDDLNLLQYVEDNIYVNLERELGNDSYTIENLTTAYISQEYIDEVAFNSQSNIFFGYNLSEIDRYFQGTRYVFTLGDDGKTTVEPMQVIKDTTADEIIKNVAIGTGVILVCVTVSYFTAGAGVPTAVNLIFTAAAKTGASFALSSGLISGVSAGIIRGIETGDMSEALEAAAIAGSESFKWGAITGAVAGGASKAISIYRSTRNIPLPRQSEIDVLNQNKNAVEQISYLDGQKVSLSTPGATRPDVVIQNADGTVKAIEVKNYNLKSYDSRQTLIHELKRQVSSRMKHLPPGSTQEIVLDVRGRGYSTEFLEKVVAYIQGHLDSIYTDIPVSIYRYA